LVNFLFPQINTILELKRNLKLSTRLQFVFDVDIDPNKSTPYFGFDKRTVQFLAQTESTADFDIYKCDTIGLISKLND